MNRIAVDIGGTFTDLVAFHEGSCHVLKIPTTSLRPEQGVIDSIARSGLPYDYVVHATTVATNSILTGKFGKVALITGRGFRDVLEIGRQNRSEMYNLYFRRPAPLIPRPDRFEVEERMLSNGRVEKPLKSSELTGLISGLCGKYDGFLVSFINSYANPEHEREAKKIIEERCPGAVVTASTDVNMEMKEYERTSTAAVNAVLKPVMSTYVSRLTQRVRNILIMQSSGGFAGPETAEESPAAFVESGPSAGAVGVHYLSRMMGINWAIGFDMGGTTAKASTVIDGTLMVTNEYEVGGRAQMGRMIRGSGYPVRFPFIDLSEVSGGGGTIAWRDRGGALRVGPHSAESDPGPACYNKGGTEATITDANLVLGRIPASLAGGEIVLHENLAAKALEKIGGSADDIALQIISLINDQMAKAIRIVTVERGLDPSEFTVFPFGGAGPLHIAEIMQDLDIRKAIIPVNPGVFSAFGLIVSDYKHDFIRPYVEGREGDLFLEMEENARELMKKEEYDGKTVESRFADVRYEGQSFELTVPFGESLAKNFETAFLKKYGYTMEGHPVEVINLRLSVSGVTEKPEFTKHDIEEGTPESKGQRNVIFSAGSVTTDIYDRGMLRAGHKIAGPAVIEGYDSTILVPPGFSMHIDSYLNVVMER